jgi:hypothetical protein
MEYLLDAPASYAELFALSGISAGTDWDVTDTWAYNEDVDTPDISTDIEAIVAKSTWGTGDQAIIILIDDDGSASSAKRYVEQYYDGDEAVLTIEYTLSTAGNVTVPLDLIEDYTGRPLIFSNRSSLGMTVTPGASRLINGDSSWEFANEDDGALIWSDGSNLFGFKLTHDWDDDGSEIVPVRARDFRIPTTNETNALFVDYSADIVETNVNTVVSADFRVVSDSASYMLFVDYSANRVGINQFEPSSTLDIDGNVFISNGLQVGRTSSDKDGLIYSQSDQGKTMVFGANDSVGISCRVGTTTNSAFFIIQNSIERAEVLSTGIWWNYPGNDYDFRIDTPTYEEAFFVDAGNEALGIKLDTTLSGADLLLTGSTNPKITLTSDGGRATIFQAKDSEPYCSVGTTTSHTFQLVTANTRRVSVGLDYLRVEEGVDFHVEGSTGGGYLFYCDEDNDRVGIGTNAPDCLFHVYAGNSGGSSHSYARITIEDDATAGLQILTPSTSYGYILFGDEASASSGQIAYNHGTDRLYFVTAGTVRAEMTSTEVVFNESSYDTNFRVESNNHAYMLFVDAGSDMVGINASELYHELTLRLDAGWGNLAYLAFGTAQGGNASDPTITFIRPGGTGTVVHQWYVGSGSNLGSASTDFGIGYEPNVSDYGAGDITNAKPYLSMSPTAVVWNEDGNDINYRIESSINDNAFYVDGGTSAIGLGYNNTGGTYFIHAASAQWATQILNFTNTRTANVANAIQLDYKLESDSAQRTYFRQKITSAVVTDASRSTDVSWYVNKSGVFTQYMRWHSTEFVINEDSVDLDFRVESNAYTHNLFLNAGTGHVIIGESTTGTGDAKLEIRSTYNSSTENATLALDDSNGAPGIRFRSIGSTQSQFVQNGAGGSFQLFLSNASEFVVNEGGSDADFRVETDSTYNFFTVYGDTDILTITSAVASRPAVQIRNTTDDANSSLLQLIKYRSPAAVNDVLGTVTFYGYDSGDNATSFSDIRGTIIDPTDGSEDGMISFRIRTAGSLVEHIRFHGSEGVVINESGADIDFRVESSGTANALTVDGGTSCVGIGMWPDSTADLQVKGRIAVGDGSVTDSDFFLTFYPQTAYLTMWHFGAGYGGINRFGLFTGAVGSENQVWYVNTSGQLGIGGAPDTYLHVHQSSAGSVSSHSYAVLTVEKTTHAAIQLLTGNTQTQYILFGDPENTARGQVAYDHNNDRMSFIAGSNRVLSLRSIDVVVNEDGDDVDFRVESDNKQYALFVQGSDGNVGIGTSAPERVCHIYSATTTPLTVESADDTMNGIIFRHTTRDATHINWSFSHRDNNEDFWLYSFDGTTYKNWIVIDYTGSISFNEDGRDIDFRVESDSVTHALFVEGSSGYVGIGSDNPAIPLHVYHASLNTVAYFVSGDSLAWARWADVNTTVSVLFGCSGDALVANVDDTTLLTMNTTVTVFNEGGADIDFRVESDGNANMLRVDAGANQVLIGTSTALASTERIGLHVSEGIAFRGNLDGADISDKAGAGGCVMGWNYAGGVGETDFIAYKGGGSRGGFMFWDYAAGSMVQLLNMHDAEAVFNDTGEDIDFRVESTASAYQIFVRGSDGFVGIGDSDPLANLHVKAGDAGASAYSYARVVIEDDTYCGLQFLSPNTVNQYIFFGDPEDSDVGSIVYNHGSDLMTFRVGAYSNFHIYATGVVVNENSYNVDFRVESNSNANMLRIDAGVDVVTIGTNTIPAACNSLNVSSGNGAGDPIMYLSNPSDNSGNRGISLRFGFDDGIGATIYAYRPSGGTYADTYLAFYASGNAYAGKIDGDLRWVINQNSQDSQAIAGHTPILQMMGDSSGESSLGLMRFQNVADGSYLHFAKSRSGSWGHTVLQADDTIGTLAWNASDGTDFTTYAAMIKGEVDAVSGTNIQGRIVFETSNSLGTSYERLSISAIETVINDIESAMDFRVGSDSNSHMLFVDAGEDTVGIGADCSTKTGYNTELVVAGSDYAVATFVGTGSSLAGATIYLTHESASPTDNDLAGTIYFCSYNDNTPLADMVAFGEITVQSTDVSEGNEHGRMVFYTMVGGVSTECITIAPTSFGPTNGVVINEGGDVAISFRVETPNYSNALLVEAGGETLNSQLVYGASVSGRDVYISSLGQFGYYSSMRWHKENIEPINRNVLERLQDVEVVQFNNTLADGEFQYGMVAEDLQYVIPELTWFDDDREPAGVDYKGFVPLLIAKEQEHEVEIRRLRRRVAELEQRLAV